MGDETYYRLNPAKTTLMRTFRGNNGIYRTDPVCNCCHMPYPTPYFCAKCHMHYCRSCQAVVSVRTHKYPEASWYTGSPRTWDQVIYDDTTCSRCYEPDE
jgi:hypothetical protein